MVIDEARNKLIGITLQLIIVESSSHSPGIQLPFPFSTRSIKELSARIMHYFIPSFIHFPNRHIHLSYKRHRITQPSHTILLQQIALFYYYTDKLKPTQIVSQLRHTRPFAKRELLLYK